MKRSIMICILLMGALPLWADSGLSNVVRKEIHRSGNSTNTPPVQAPAATIQETRAQPVLPSVQPVQEAFKEQKKVSFTRAANYPYTIHLASFENPNDAARRLERLKPRMDMLFVTKIDLGAPGVWYRLDCGAFPNIKEAVAKLQELKSKGLVEQGSFVGGSVAYAIEIGAYPSRQEAQARAKALVEKGVTGYILQGTDDLYRLLSGAYPDENSAAPALEDLSALNFAATVKKR